GRTALSSYHSPAFLSHHSSLLFYECQGERNDTEDSGDFGYRRHVECHGGSRLCACFLLGRHFLHLARSSALRASGDGAHLRVLCSSERHLARRRAPLVRL